MGTWRKHRHKYNYTAEELSAKTYVEQGQIAVDLLYEDGYNWIKLETMFSRGRLKRRSTKYNLPNHTEEYNACTTNDQRYRFLKQLEAKYEHMAFPARIRGKWHIILGNMVGQDYRSINRVLSSNSFQTAIIYRMENYHGVQDFDALKIITEKIGAKTSIMCYCGKRFMVHDDWHIHHCHECGQVIGICHAECNVDEPKSTIIMNWMFGPNIISNIHARQPERYTAPSCLPTECSRCNLRIVSEEF